MHRTIRIVAATAVGSLALTAGAAAQAVEWRVADGGNGHWYRYFDEPLDWAVAQSRCASSGGHLITLTSALEYSFVH
jgi:hypothetical protein